MKRAPQNAKAYAEYLYMLPRCQNITRSMTDIEIVECRVRAFVDGVNWQKRQAKKAKQGSARGDAHE